MRRSSPLLIIIHRSSALCIVIQRSSAAGYECRVVEVVEQYCELSNMDWYVVE